MELSAIGRLLLTLGVVLALAGLFLLGLTRLTGVQGWRLPGDLVYRRDNVTIYLPLATSILISILLTLFFYLLAWLGRR